jgi:hypothetical protein
LQTSLPENAATKFIIVSLIRKCDLMQSRLVITIILLFILGALFFSPKSTLAQSGNPESIADRFVNAAYHSIAAGIPSTGDPAADLATLMGLSATLLTLAKAVRANGSNVSDEPVVQDDSDINLEFADPVEVGDSVSLTTHRKR